MRKQRVKVVLDANGFGYVEVDGERLSNACAVTVAGRVGNLTTVTVELIDLNVEIEADADVVLKRPKQSSPYTDDGMGARYERADVDARVIP